MSIIHYFTNNSCCTVKCHDVIWKEGCLLWQRSIVHRIDLVTGSVYNVYNCIVFYTVSSMSILCLWDIQLTFDWVGTEPYPRKSNLHSCKHVQGCLRARIFCGSYYNFRTSEVNANGQFDSDEPLRINSSDERRTSNTRTVPSSEQVANLASVGEKLQNTRGGREIRFTTYRSCLICAVSTHTFVHDIVLLTSM